MTREGIHKVLRSQVCNVNKPLLSVSKIAEVGHRVVFDEHRSFIEDKKTGEQITLTKKDGVYVVKLWVMSGKARAAAQGFAWQGM